MCASKSVTIAGQQTSFRSHSSTSVRACSTCTCWICCAGRNGTFGGSLQLFGGTPMVILPVCRPTAWVRIDARDSPHDNCTGRFHLPLIAHGADWPQPMRYSRRAAMNKTHAGKNDLTVDYVVLKGEVKRWCVYRGATVLAERRRLDHAFLAARQIAHSDGGHLWLVGVDSLIPIRYKPSISLVRRCRRTRRCPCPRRASASHFPGRVQALSSDLPRH